MVQVGHDVQVATLQITPVLLAIGPHDANSISKRVFTIFLSFPVEYKTVLVLGIQEWTTSALLIIPIVSVITYENFIVLEVLVNISVVECCENRL